MAVTGFQWVNRTNPLEFYQEILYRLLLWHTDEMVKGIHLNSRYNKKSSSGAIVRYNIKEAKNSLT